MRQRNILYAAGSLMVLTGFMSGAHAEDGIMPWSAGASAKITPGAVSMPAGVLSFGGNIQYLYSPNVRLGSHWESNATGAQKYDNTIKARYGLTDDLGTRIAIPVYNFYSHSRNTGASTQKKGVGDVSLMFDYRFWDQKKGKPLSLALSVGGYLPLGSVSSKTIDSIGSESWGGAIQFSADYAFGNSRLDTEVHYATFNRGMHDYQHGDRIRWNTSYTYALNRAFEIGAESTFEHGATSRRHNAVLNDGYTEWHTGLAGTYNAWGTGTHVSVFFTMPVYRHYDKATSSDDYRMGIKIIQSVHVGTPFQ